MSWFGTVASVAMAVAPPLAYSDQCKQSRLTPARALLGTELAELMVGMICADLSIVRKKNSGGFSIDICGVLLVANITRVSFPFGPGRSRALNLDLD